MGCNAWLKISLLKFGLLGIGQVKSRSFIRLISLGGPEGR